MVRTLADLFEAYLADTRLSHAASTHYQQRTFFGLVLRDLGPLPVEEVSADVLRAWKGHMSTKHTRETVRRYMRFLHCCFRWAIECAWLAADPFTHVRLPSPGRRHVRFLTQAERQRLLVACQESKNPMLYALVVVALGTGARKNEARRLQWPAVDLEGGEVRFLVTKTATPRTVPLVGEAHRVLVDLAQHRHAPVPWVFPHQDGSRPFEMESAWITARRHAQLTDLRFHDLRHTYASYLAMSGASLRDIAELLGHQKIQCTMIYTHLLPSRTADVVRRMTDQFLQQPDQQGENHA